MKPPVKPTGNFIINQANMKIKMNNFTNINKEPEEYCATGSVIMLQHVIT